MPCFRDNLHNTCTKHARTTTSFLLCLKSCMRLQSNYVFHWFINTPYRTMSPHNNSLKSGFPSQLKQKKVLCLVSHFACEEPCTYISANDDYSFYPWRRSFFFFFFFKLTLVAEYLGLQRLNLCSMLWN